MAGPVIAPDWFLDTPVGEHLSDLVRGAFAEREAEDAMDADVADPAARGDRFGAYRVTRELGRGGMGMVYEAERADEHYDRRVAIKTVAVAAPGGHLVRRFGAERRILAGLEHANIARLYDAGATPGGTPFLVMEYVEGRRIDRYCEANRLAVEEILRLFDAVCEAVEYAHGRLVVHRDIKPGNILVDEAGSPKLLDFGVARLLDALPDAASARALDAGAPAAGATAPGGPATAPNAGPRPRTTGPHAMTPEYASPEQLRGEPVTTASDVYSLGVLLYVLLTGQHPYRVPGRSPAALEQVIREGSIRPPSEVADGWRADARARLAGDVDSIVLKAMHPEPARRYASVGDLRRDVRDHLADLPIAARPATRRYRARKFARRHRTGLAAAVLVILALGLGLAGTAWQASAAAREAERAERTRDYLISLFETFDPDAAGATSVTAAELLDRGAERLEALEAGPATRGELQAVLGSLYARLGLYDRARPLLVAALATLRDTYGDEHPTTSAAMTGLTSVFFERAEYEEAEELAGAVLDARRRLFGDGDTAVATALSNLAAIHTARGALDEARLLHEEALSIDRRAGRPEQVATDLDNLGVIHIRKGEYAEARSLLEESLGIRRELHGERHTRVANSMLNLSEALSGAGEYDEAERLLRACIEIRRELLGPRHPHVGLALNNLGSTLQRSGRLEAAERAHTEALEIRREALGEDHPDVAASLNNLAVVAYFRGNYAEAAEQFEQAAATWRPLLGEEHPNVLTALNNAGAARREAGEYETAERLLRRVLSLRREVLGDDHPDIGQSLNNLAIVLHRRGEIEEAERTYREAIASWRASLGDDHPTLASGLVGLGQLLFETGRCAEGEEGEAPLREALTLREAALDAESTGVATARAWLGLCLAESGAAGEAGSLLAAALPPLEAMWGEDDALVQRVRRQLARGGGVSVAAGAEP